MGKMKELMIEWEEQMQEQTPKSLAEAVNVYGFNPVMDYLLNGTVKDMDAENDDVLSLQEEAHYMNTIDNFVSLIEVYGWETVMMDLRSKMREVKW